MNESKTGLQNPEATPKLKTTAIALFLKADPTCDCEGHRMAHQAATNFAEDQYDNPDLLMTNMFLFHNAYGAIDSKLDTLNFDFAGPKVLPIPYQDNICRPNTQWSHLEMDTQGITLENVETSQKITCPICLQIISEQSAAPSC